MGCRILVKPEFLAKQHWTMDNKSISALETPFKLKAEDFLDFAKKDVEEKSLRGDVNAITNIKRCIENRLDSLLFLFGYYEVASKEKWSFPKKLSILEELGVKAPQILHKRINLRRVMLEHVYEKPPEHEEIVDFIDVAELFLLATQTFLRDAVTDLGCMVEDKKGLTLMYMSMEFAVGKGKITVQIFGGSNERGRFGPLKEELSLGTDDENHSDWIRFYNKLAYYS
jgi:hypothetical protein